MTTQQPEALRLAEILEGGYSLAWLYERGGYEGSAELRRQHARIADLEAQLEAIGAGGVSGPLIGQPQAMPDLSQLTERGAKAWAGVDAQGLREGFTAADMATASAQGFRDGVASVSAVSETVATVFTMEALTPGGGVKYHATIHKALPAGTKLYAAPQPSYTAQADSVLEDAALWHWLAEYLVGTRTDLDDEIVASETVNDLRKLVETARKQGEKQ